MYIKPGGPCISWNVLFIASEMEWSCESFSDLLLRDSGHS